MSPYDKEKELTFIDREIYCNLIDSVYQNILKDTTYFKVVVFWGTGGIGKSRLLNESQKNMCNPSAKPLFIKLEITSKDDLLDILIKFRKALPQHHLYPLFDYAMLVLWNNLNVTQLDDRFLHLIGTSLFEFAKSGLDISLGMYTGIPVASIIDLLHISYDKIRKLSLKKQVDRILNNITCMDAHELVKELPILLANDIHKAFLNTSLVFVIDSFKQYSSYLPNEMTWLVTLIQNIGYGIFIITSREKIIWPEDMRENVITKNLNQLPKSEVRNVLIRQYPQYSNLVENVITVTDCIPIYLDMAVNVIDRINQDNLSVNEIYFKTKEDIISRFLIHLPNDEREAIIVLSIVQIFDETIFDHLVHELNLAISILSFEDICNRSIIRNLEYDNYFYKIHDVISNNISYIETPYKKKQIFKSYLTFLCKRGCNLYDSIQTNMLFKHILEICIRNEMVLTVEENEMLLDIFFTIKESLLPFNCDEINGFENYEPLKNIYFFLKALSEERQNSKIRLSWLKQINEKACCFGEHLKSYQLMKSYLRALCEGTQYLKMVVDPLQKELSDQDIPKWYYGQTKIFFGDCCISYGKFSTGIAELKKYAEDISNLITKKNDYFQVHRHIAHGYRFNMMLEEAEKEYETLISNEKFPPTPLQKIYILTNLCETNCYFKPNDVIKLSREALPLANKFHDLKSKGKIYYSLAIAWTIQKKYKQAKKFIKKSLFFNEQDGYIAGKLYAYIAQAYLEYSLKKYISNSTMNIIQNIQKQIQVYGYFSLPIALMQKETGSLKKIRQKYEWINFDKTVLTYRRFLDSLSIPKA